MINDLLKEVMTVSYVKSDLINSINNELTQIKIPSKHKAIYNEMFDLIQHGRITRTTKNQIQEYLNVIGEFKYNKISHKKPNNNEIENILDLNIKIYCHFTDSKPMKNVRYNKTKNIYTVSLNDKKKEYKSIDKACDMSLKYLLKSYKNKNNIITQYQKGFQYNDRNFITYIGEDQVYFDIRHIISVLNISPQMQEKKYKEFSKNIIGYNYFKNIYDGYVIREFIDEETLYDIILSSNSDFSKSFKKDIGKILCKFRVIKPHENTKKTKDNSGCCVDDVRETLKTITSKVSCIYLLVLGTVKELRTIMNIQTDFNDECYVIKYGKTDDLSKRLIEHKRTFKNVDNILLRLKYVACVDSQYISTAEVDIKKAIKMQKAIFRFGDMTELAIVSNEQLNELKNVYKKCGTQYRGQLELIVSNFNTEKAVLTNENNILNTQLKDAQNNYEKLLKKYEKLKHKRHHKHHKQKEE